MIYVGLSNPVLFVEYIAVIQLCVQIFLKAHFSYDPKRDSLIPCREAGLPFRMGEILEVVNRDDPNWWQVSSAVLQLGLGIFYHSQSGVVYDFEGLSLSVCLYVCLSDDNFWKSWCIWTAYMKCINLVIGWRSRSNLRHDHPRMRVFSYR